MIQIFVFFFLFWFAHVTDSCLRTIPVQPEFPLWPKDPVTGRPTPPVSAATLNARTTPPQTNPTIVYPTTTTAQSTTTVQPTTTTTTTTTAAPVKTCNDCTFESLLKPVSGPNEILPDDYLDTEVNGCKATEILCRNTMDQVCTFEMFVTNSMTGTTASIGTDVTIIMSETSTCNANGLYEFDGKEFDGVFCTMKDCT